MTTTHYPVDNSAILYLALMKPHHSNSYRFTMTMTEPVCPQTLQAAVDRITPRFPTIIAGFRPSFSKYTMVPAEAPPTVMPDPGLLRAMRREEIHNCAYRVFYRGNEITFEAFHALTDGYGAVASFTTLVAEYLRLRHGIDIPVCNTLRSIGESPKQEELDDSYLVHQSGEPLQLPSRYSYQLPHPADAGWDVKTCARVYATADILAAARRLGVSATGLFSGLMASSIMELQREHRPKSIKPVRIMIPVDLRRMFDSKTLRNFILFALPTMEPGDENKPLAELLRSFHAQLQQQVTPELMARRMAYNVRIQSAWWNRLVPVSVLHAVMRFGYRYFGESNSSITLTNLGSVRLPAEMAPYVENLEVVLTPRAGSPYNCAIISCGDKLTINLSRLVDNTGLETRFFQKLDALLSETI